MENTAAVSQSKQPGIIVPQPGIAQENKEEISRGVRGHAPLEILKVETKI